jgi:hypothetical protein
MNSRAKSGILNFEFSICAAPFLTPSGPDVTTLANGDHQKSGAE